MTQPATPLHEAATYLEQLATTLNLDFDLLLVGDGSGTVLDMPCGWACIAYDRVRNQVTVHRGASSCGTTNFAELMPYVQALWHYHRNQPPLEAVVEVAIISDSEVTVHCGNRRYARRANGCLWAAMEYFEAIGYFINWWHIPRNSNNWSAHADTLAGAARRLILDSEPNIVAPTTKPQHSVA